MNQLKADSPLEGTALTAFLHWRESKASAKQGSGAYRNDWRVNEIEQA